MAAVEVALAVAGDPPWPPGLPTAAVALAGSVLVWRLPRTAYDRWRYELAETTLELRRGIVVHTETAIPYFRVQHIDITRSPVERLLGLSQLVVRTAAASTDATIPGIAAGEAEALRDVILARTGRDDV
jgi:membrane protein YdbS with pleckstrin-like domain